MNNQNPWENQRLGYISQALDEMERGYNQGRHSEGNESLAQMHRIAGAEDTIKTMNNLPRNMSPTAWAMLQEQIAKMRSGWGHAGQEHYTGPSGPSADIYGGRRGISAILGRPYEEMFPIHGSRGGIKDPEGQAGISSGWDDWREDRGIKPYVFQG